MILAPARLGDQFLDSFTILFRPRLLRSLVTKYGTSLFFIRLLFPTQSIPKLLSIEATSRTIKELLEEVGNLYINIKLKSGFNISA